MKKEAHFDDIRRKPNGDIDSLLAKLQAYHADYRDDGTESVRTIFGSDGTGGPDAKDSRLTRMAYAATAVEVKRKKRQREQKFIASSQPSLETLLGQEHTATSIRLKNKYICRQSCKRARKQHPG